MEIRGYNTGNNHYGTCQLVVTNCGDLILRNTSSEINHSTAENGDPNNPKVFSQQEILGMVSDASRENCQTKSRLVRRKIESVGNIKSTEEVLEGMIQLDDDGNLFVSQETAYFSSDLFVQVGFVTNNQTNLVDDRCAFIPI